MKSHLFNCQTQLPSSNANVSLYEFSGMTLGRASTKGGAPVGQNNMWLMSGQALLVTPLMLKTMRSFVVLKSSSTTHIAPLMISNTQSWSAFYQHCQRQCDHDNPDSPPEAIEEEMETNTESVEEGNDDKPFQDDAWMAEAGCAPNAHMGGNIGHLGQPDMDDRYPWTQSDQIVQGRKSQRLLIG
jgi:hypothetical protein